MDNLFFNQKILGWYTLEKRDLPWRHTSDPYKIWISEVILQQTRISQGINYYLRFIEAFPTVQSLAKASEDEVLRLWQGLGYYSRARNLHSGAKQIVASNSAFPASFQELLKIKGIGEYTAAAIASIAYNEPVAAVDGNVYRVLSRFFGIATAIDSTKGKKEFKELAATMLSNDSPGDYNQALMEFGALQCVPKNPDCTNCLFNENCAAYKNDEVGKLPVKQKKIKQSERYLYYIIIEKNQKLLLQKRTNDDIWKNLYEFPLIETKTHISPEELFETKAWSDLFQNERLNIIAISEKKKHLLSHQRLWVHFIHVDVNSLKKFSSNFIIIDKKNIFDFAIPRVIDRYLRTK